MFTTINLPQTVMTLVESMLPRGNPDQALYVPLSLRLGNLEVGTQSSRLVLFFYRPKAYTLVAARTDSLGVCREKGERFHLRSYHDSAWRHDGVEDLINSAYRELRAGLTQRKVGLTAWAQFDPLSGLGVHPVDEVEFDTTDYDKPVVVHWKS